MSFLPALSPRGGDRNGARVRLHMQVTGRHADRRQLTFVLSRTLLDQLGWQMGERICIAIGTGEDLGAFQATRSGHPRAGAKLSPNSNSSGARLSLSLPPEIHGVRPADFLDRLDLPQHLDIDIDGKALVMRTRLAEAALTPRPVLAASK